MEAEPLGKNMKRILVLSRGTRLAELFYQISKELTKNYQVIAVVHTYVSKEKGAELSGTWKPVSNLFIHDMADGIRRAYVHFLNSGEDPIETLRRVEKELDLTLYKSASNFLYYRRFSKAYYKHWDGYCGDESKLIEEFLGSYLFFKKLFETYEPSLVFCETPDLIAHRVAAALAFNRNIFTVANYFDTTYNKNRIFLVSGVERRNILLEHYFHNPHRITQESYGEAKVLLERLSEGGPKSPEHISTYRKQVQERLTKKLWRHRRKFFAPDGVTTALRRSLQRQKNKKWLDKVMKFHLPETPYVLFLLHHQPEISTGLAAPRWNDQNLIAEQLAANAPVGVKIVVKENPKTYGLRGKEYFEFLLDYPNIHLLHPSVDPIATFKNSLIILSVGGTAGLEGLLMRKRVAALGRPFYSFFEGAEKLNYPDEIFEALSKSFPQSPDYEDRLLQFAASHIQSTFYIGKNIPGEPWPAATEGGKLYAHAIAEFLRVVERDTLKPSQFRIGV